MTEISEVLDIDKKELKPVPGIVSIIAIFSYIIFGIMLIGGAVSLGLMVKNHDLYYQSANNGFFIGIIFLSVFLLILIMSIYGAALMHKGRKKGFVFYVIGVGLIGLSILWVSFKSVSYQPPSEAITILVVGGLCFLFITIFATQLKNLN
ncbi:MAG: magnesium-transporting ATPase (P-type) [Crocinitomix sp.]|jgi:magnesium-transporting ATPase (P-type)